MSSLFSTPSPIDRKVDAATSDLLAEAPLDTYLEIAADIKSSPDAGQSHLKALRRRLTAKSSHTAYLALQLLDVAVKNGGDAFHETVSNPTFLGVVATVGTTAKERHVSDLALSLLYQWARVFPAQGLMSYADAYNKLKNKGVTFPDAGTASTAPVFTPPPNLAIHAPPRHVATSRAPDRSPNRSPSRSPRAEQKEPSERSPLSWASPFYVDKIKVESMQVVEYLTLFQQMVASEAAQQLKANESVQSLHSTIVDCRSRVTRLLAEIEDETVMDIMIQLNDAIRTSLDYYDERLKGRPVPEPTVVVPTGLRKGAEGERKEGKEQSADKQQGEQGEDPFVVALANHPQPQTAQQQRAAAPAAAAAVQQPAAAGGSGTANALSQFDPLA